MSVHYHFLCRPVEKVGVFESELNKMLDEGWQVKEDVMPRIIRDCSRQSDKLFVTLVKESETKEEE